MHVIVVGAGPSGLVLSLLLAKYGIQAHLIDKGEKLDESPRASHYSPPAVRYLALAGVIDEAQQQGLLPAEMTWRKPDGTLIATINMAANDGDPNRLLCLTLDLLGKLLYKHVQAQPSIKVDWSYEVTDIGQDGDKAWVDVKTPEGQKRLEGDYIVGCDGASSQIRRCLFGTDSFPGKTWDVQIVATNVYYDLHKYGWADINTIIGRNNFMMCARITRDGLWRISYGEDVGFTDEELIARQPKSYERLLPGSPKPSDYHITNISPYKMHQRLAPSMNEGRFLLAADAAHVVTPFGGLGLSGGIVDAGNLADCLLAIRLLPTTPPNRSPRPSSQAILAAYSEVRRQKWIEVTDPISSANLLRLLEVDPDKAVEQDEFMNLVKRSETDKALCKEILQGIYELDYDFEARWGKELGLDKGWIRKAMAEVSEASAKINGA